MNAREDFMRRVRILQLIPRSPAKISVSRLVHKLSDLGHTIHLRSVQRDLRKLEHWFALGSDQSDYVPGWFWLQHAGRIELPAMSPTAALAFKMVQKHLNHALPAALFSELNEYFAYSDQVLQRQENTSILDWSNKVALLSRTQPLHYPRIKREILETIYEGLFLDCKIQATYIPRDKTTQEYMITPLAIVAVDCIVYLIGFLESDEPIKHFALHRFEQVEILEISEPEPIDFDLYAYIEEGHFEYVLTEDEICCTIKLSPEIEAHLYESKLSENQIIEKQGDDILLYATVKNTKQLRWWLQGFGDKVEVLEPAFLRNEFAETAKQLIQMYSR